MQTENGEVEKEAKLLELPCHHMARVKYEKPPSIVDLLFKSIF